MTKSTGKLTMVLVGAHIVITTLLIITEATHGISDQDASFLLALIVRYLNLPAVWLLDLVGLPATGGILLVAGAIQWAGIAVLLAMLVDKFHDKRPEESPVTK